MQDNIYDIYTKGQDNKLTQLVFCDLSTPKDNKGYEQDGFLDAYNDIKKKLIEKGIPDNEIAFIHEADSEAKKKGFNRFYSKNGCRNKCTR